MNGVLLIDKPAGMTSHDVVARVRKIIGERRVGHTGTLDPFATGLLVILIGRATRLAQFLSGAEKEYEGLIRLGYATDTGDVTGTRIACEEPRAKRRSAQSLRPDEIQAAMASLQGEIEQVPPMYSAKKVQGKKLYEFARAGQEVERQPVRVTVREFVMSSPDELLCANGDGSVDLRVRVVCSAGTYIRTLAEDFGQKLGIESHLAELRRTRAGLFELVRSVTFETLAEVCNLEMLDGALIAPYDALSHLPVIELDPDQAHRTMHGLALDLAPAGPQSLIDGDAVRLAANGELIAVGRFDATQGMIHPAVVLVTG